MVDYKELLEPYKKLIDESGQNRKYSSSGIYCIKINDKLVYIGKSKDMYNRVACHMANIHEELASDYRQHKYELLREALRAGYKIQFDVLFYCPESELDEHEGRLIREYLPALNYQIPKEGGGWTCQQWVKNLRGPQFLSLLEGGNNDEL